MTLVVVGASLAGLRAVEAARGHGYDGEIVLVGAESHIPYDRPPLSKEYLSSTADHEQLTTEAQLRDDLLVDVRLSSVAESINPAQHTLVVNGEILAYDKLIVATGSSPRVPPGMLGKAGALTLRTVEDAAGLRERLTAGSRVVIVGAGVIGSEIASSAKKSGAEVTILEGAPVPLVRAVGEAVGEALASLHERHGVTLRRPVRVDRLTGGGHVSGVLLEGGEIVPADVVVVGVGAVPSTSWLADSGIELSAADGSVVCDAYLRTSVEDVYAAGDLVHWPNAIMEQSMRLENWTNAAEQGRRAALNALFPSESAPYSTVPYFWSDWYGHRIQFVGSPDADEVRFVLGSPEELNWVALYRRGERLIGAATLNERRWIMKLRRLIADGSPWEAALRAVSDSTIASGYA